MKFQSELLGVQSFPLLSVLLLRNSFCLNLPHIWSYSRFSGWSQKVSRRKTFRDRWSRISWDSNHHSKWFDLLFVFFRLISFQYQSCAEDLGNTIACMLFGYIIICRRKARCDIETQQKFVSSFCSCVLQSGMSLLTVVQLCLLQYLSMNADWLRHSTHMLCEL